MSSKRETLNKIAVAFLCSELEYEISVDCDTCINLSKLFGLDTKCEATGNTDCVIRYNKLLKAIKQLVEPASTSMLKSYGSEEVDRQVWVCKKCGMKCLTGYHSVAPKHCPNCGRKVKND